MSLPRLTIGVEEEYQIIHPETRELTSYVQEFLDQGRLILRDQIKPEFLHVISQPFAVVRRHDHRSVLVQALLLQCVQQPSDLIVDVTHLAAVVAVQALQERL